MHQMHVQNMPMQPMPMHNMQPMMSAPVDQRTVRPIAQKQSVFSKMRFASLSELID
jgi:hypothetical protein